MGRGGLSRDGGDRCEHRIVGGGCPQRGPDGGPRPFANLRVAEVLRQDVTVVREPTRPPSPLNYRPGFSGAI